jgi:WXG100 family type VII secretion target
VDVNLLILPISTVFSMTNIIQVDYEALSQVASGVRNQSEVVAALQQRVERAAQQLLSDGWQGRGSTAFAAEYAPVRAALQRLATVLGEAAALIATEIPQTYRSAEEEAAAPFQGRYDGTAGAAPGAAAAVAAASTAGAATGADSSPNSSNGLLSTLGNAVNTLTDTLGNTYNQIQSAFVPQVDLPQQLNLNEHSTMADLYRLNANQYDAPPGGIEQAVRVFTDDNGQYLISIMGTDNDFPYSLAWWDSNLDSGRGRTSTFSAEVAAYLKRLNLPEGATLHFVGHSQGGHVSNILAQDPAIANRFEIGSITTFGSSSNAFYNADIGAEKYHNYISTDDVLMVGLDAGAKHVQQKYYSTDVQDRFVQNRFLAHDSGGHSGYGDIQQLQQTKVPFTMTSFRQVSSFAPQHHTVDALWSSRFPLHATVARVQGLFAL